MRPTRNRSAVCARSIWIVERRPRNDRIEADFEDCDCAGDSAAHPGYQDLRGAGLCIRLSAGVSQYGDRPAGRGRPSDILPAERRYSAGNRVSHKPLWAAEVGLLAAGQGAGFEVCG